MRRGVPARRLATWLLLGASLAGAASFVAMRLVLPSDGGRIAFYEDAWSPTGVAIAPVDAPAAGLRDGDRVERIAGRSLEDWTRLALDPSVGRPGSGPVAYVVERDGAEVALDETWARPSIGATLVDGWSVVLFSVAIAGVAAFVYLRRPDAPAAVPLVIAASAAAGSSVPWLLGLTTSDLVLGAQFVYHSLLTFGLYMLLWPAGAHLALTFPATAPLVVRHPRVIPAAYALTIGSYLALLIASGLASATTLEWIGTWPRSQLAVIVPVIVAVVVLFGYNLRTTTDPAARARVRWAALGGLTSAVAGLLLFQLPELVLGRSLLPTSWIGLAALPLPLGIAIGILRDRLFDLDVAVNRTLVYGGLTVGVLASYAVAATALGAVLGGASGFGASLLASGLAALVALPLRDALQRAVNRLLYGERDEPWRVMRRLGQRLEWAAEPDRAFPAIVEIVADALRLPFVALEVTVEPGGHETVAQHGSRPDDVTIVPLAHGAQTVGRLVLGYRPGERGFRPDELHLLEDLGRQAGAAIHALHLRDALARSRERLVLAREEERRRLRRDLHDGLGPSLAAIGLRAEASAETLASDPAEAQRLLAELGGDVRVALADVRRLVDGLRPPALDEMGLLAAIDHEARRLEGNGSPHDLAISVDGRPSPLPELPAAVEVAAYRIAVEAVTNAVRHAGAHNCRVRIDVDTDLAIEVADDGRGLPAGHVPGTGLESMTERAAELGGELRVEERPDGGTRVVARLPLTGTVRP